MLEFLRENAAGFAGMSVGAVFWLILNWRSVRGNIKNIDKKRAEQGMSEMTDDESKIITGVMRSSVINDAIGAFTGGVVAIVVGYLFIR